MEQIVQCNIEKLSDNLPAGQRKETELRKKVNEIIDFLANHEFVTNVPEDY